MEILHALQIIIVHNYPANKRLRPLAVKRLTCCGSHLITCGKLILNVMLVTFQQKVVLHELHFLGLDDHQKQKENRPVYAQ